MFFCNEKYTRLTRVAAEVRVFMRELSETTTDLRRYAFFLVECHLPDDDSPVSLGRFVGLLTTVATRHTPSEMGRTSKKVKSTIARLKDKFVLWEKKDGAEEAELSVSNSRELGWILEAYELRRVLGNSEWFAKPPTVSVLRPGYFRMEHSMWPQRLVAEVRSVGKHEVHYVNAAGYWLVLMDVVQKLAYEEGTKEEGVIRFLAFSVLFGLASKRVLTMRMEYYQLAVTSGAPFAAQMAKTVKAPMMEVEITEYAHSNKEYQRSLSQQVVKISAKGEAARSLRAQEESSGSFAGRQE